MTLFESQSNLVEAEMERIIDPSPDVELKHARKLIAELRTMPPAAEFLKAHQLNAMNIFDWSRQVIAELLQ